MINCGVHMKYALLTCFATALFLLLPRSYAGAENAGKINEDALFNQEETLVAPETITNDAISSDVDKNSVSFSGFLNSRLQYYMNRNWIQGKYLPLQMIFIDEFEKGNKTIVELSGISLTKLDPKIFTKAYLEFLSK